MTIEDVLHDLRDEDKPVWRMQLADALEAAMREKDAEIERLTKEVEKWQYAFSAQSHKLESVLHIPGVRAVLSGKEDV
jgi:hypothetical protein